MGDPIDREESEKAAPVPLPPCGPHRFAFYERVGETETAEQDKYPNPLRPSFKKCRKQRFHGARQLLQDRTARSALFEEPSEVSKTEQPRIPAPIGDETMKIDDPEDRHAAYDVHPFEMRRSGRSGSGILQA